MLVLPDFNKPYIIDSLTAPIVIKYNWIFNGPAMDFMLSKISYLEETIGPAVKVRINATEFWMPATWFILVTDEDTFQVDTVNIQDCAKRKYAALNFSPTDQNARLLDITVIDAVGEDSPMTFAHPMINKATALIHPVGPSEPRHGRVHQLNVVIGPHDLYKHIAGKVVGDLLSY